MATVTISSEELVQMLEKFNPFLTPETLPKTYKITYECGHSATINYTERKKFTKCTMLCGKRLPCGHECQKLCSQPCEPCEEMQMIRKFTRCSHKYNVKCCEKQNALTQECPYRVIASIIPDCGHFVKVACKDRTKFDSDQLSVRCTEPCANGNFDYGGCGHPCLGICRTCFNGIYHERCSHDCGRSLICGHYCETKCSKNCPPCPKKCRTSCEHGVCQDPCGMPCSPCEEPCAWECPHHKCTKKCDEVCDREPCNLPCKKILPCKHLCVGFCGEPCPVHCRYCNVAALLEGFFDGRNKIEETDRFIYLVDCGHTFEAESLKSWMEVEDENGEITMKSCPLCRQIIWTCRRFNAIITRRRSELIEVKIKIFGDLSVIFKIQCDLYGQIAETSHIHGMFDDFKTWLCLQMAEEEENELGEPVFLQLDNGKVYCLRYLYELLKDSERRFVRFTQEYHSEEFNVMEHYYREIWHFVRTRGIPLTMTETADLERQLDRFEDMIQLMDRRRSDVPHGYLNIRTTPGALEIYDEAYSHVASRAAYTTVTRAEFKHCLEKLDKALKCQLGITDSERKMIVRAFGTSLGRWFKCQNGHVYVITECGGPTEVGVCNECGTAVGGTRHMAVTGNELATEMDGAVTPLYPTALTAPDLLEYVDFN